MQKPTISRDGLLPSSKTLLAAKLNKPILSHVMRLLTLQVTVKSNQLMTTLLLANRNTLLG